MPVNIFIKKCPLLFLVLLLTLLVAMGCKGKVEEVNAHFNATVLETDAQSVLVEPFEETAERKSADKISVSTKVTSTHEVPYMEAGTKIRIVYDGSIAESYPAQINHTIAIYLIDDDGEILENGKK